MKKCIKCLLSLLVISAVMTVAVIADEVNKDLCINMQKIDGMGYLLTIDGILYGFEEKDGITAGIGRFAEPSSEMSEKMSSFVTENEKVIYFEIKAFDTETETVSDYSEKTAMEAEVFMPAGTGFSAAMGKGYRVYSISDTATELSVTDSSLYEFSFELDTFGTYAVVYSPNAITLNFYDGENIYHTIKNLATTDQITLPENPQNKDIDGIEYEFCGWYSREEGQGLRLYDGVTLANIGSSSVFAYWQPADDPYIESLELWDYPEADDDIAGSLYGYRETDEMTVKLMRFSEDSETATQLASRIDFLVKDGMKAMFFALVEYDKVNDQPYGFADGMTLGVTIKLASEGFLGKNYKVYNMNSSEDLIAASVTESDPLSFTFLTEGLGVFAVVYDPRLVSVSFYNDGTLYHKAKLTLYDMISYPEGEENLLIEFTEKDFADGVVKTEYYFVDRSENAVKKLPMDFYMSSYNETSVRTGGNVGIRFKANILTGVKYEETEFVIKEYGFVVSRKDLLGEDELTLDTEMKVTGVAYNRADGTDIVFDSNDEYCTFTGIVKNVPVEHYRTDLVCKTYTKISVNGEQFVVYGEAIVGNIYDTAKKLLETNPDNEGLINIVLDYEKTLGLSGDDLYQ